MQRRTMAIVLLAVGTFVTAGDCGAEEDELQLQPAVGVWSEKMELSFVDTGGNTQVTTLSFKNVLKRRFVPRVLGTWKLTAVYGKSDGERNAENYGTEFRGDYDFSSRLYGLGYLGWMRDTFSGVDARYSVGLGPGYRFLTGPQHRLLGELGLSYTREKNTDDETEAYWGGRVFGSYEYVFVEKNMFSQSMEFLFDFSEIGNWKLNTETAAVAAINDILGLKASYSVRYANRPVEDLERTDTVLGMSLELTL